MSIDLPDWAAVLAYIFAALAGFGGALAILRSKYRVAADGEREKYIAALEARNKLLEETTTRQDAEMEALKARHNELRGQFQFLSRMVLGKCPYAAIDPDTGGCVHCELKQTCGQEPEARPNTGGKA